MSQSREKVLDEIKNHLLHGRVDDLTCAGLEENLELLRSLYRENSESFTYQDIKYLKSVSKILPILNNSIKHREFLQSLYLSTSYQQECNEGILNISEYKDILSPEFIPDLKYIASRLDALVSSIKGA